jgi:UDP-GlcNAc:undecaprenyl-phosphate/decaprenyl-phosphate GlcNAc-1-phosphate transferase
VKDYVLTLLVAAAVTYVLTPLVRRFAIAVGAIKQQPRERDVHTAPVPSVGGLAMYLGLAAALFVANEISQLHDNAIAGTGMLPGLLGAGGLLVIIGFIDDRFGLSALTKGAGQVAAGGILVATGATFSWLPWPGGSGHIFIPSPDEKALLTILIVVATINAVNFIDGLDGLAAGIVAIAAISFFAYYYSLTKLVDISSLAAPALASAVLIGMCIGFLPHNFAPAKIFMGDTGAMLLGLVLAYSPISAINTVPAAQLQYSINRYPVIMPLLLPAVLLVIPYGDMLLAVVRRTRAGQSPFAADRKHLHHRLLDIGHSMRASVLIMYLWAAAFSGTVTWLSIEKTELPKAPNHHGEPVIFFVVTTAVAVAILLLLSMPWRHWREQARTGAAAAQAAATAGMRPPGRGNEAPGVTERSAGDLVATAGPTRSVMLSGLRPSPAGQPKDRELNQNRDGALDAVAEDGAGEWTSVGEAGTWQGEAAEAGSGDGRDGARPDEGRQPDARDEVARDDVWRGVAGDYGPPSHDGGLAEFVTDEDGRSAAGTVPPMMSDSDWAWFRPTAGSLPESGRPRGEL